MTDPKMKPCPRCGAANQLVVYRYDSGWRHVECENCWYLGPGEGLIQAAIKSHNEQTTSQRDTDDSDYDAPATSVRSKK